MATKSILKDVKVRDKYFGRSLANALENSKATKTPQAVFQRQVIRVEKEDVKKYLGKE